MAISLLFHKGLTQRKCVKNDCSQTKNFAQSNKSLVGGPELLLLRAKFFVREQSILVNFCPYRLWARSHRKQGGRIIYKRMLRKKRTFGAALTQNKPLNWMVSNTEISRKWCLGTFATLVQKILSNLTLSKTEINRKTCFGTFATRRTQNIRTGRRSKLH